MTTSNMNQQDTMTAPDDYGLYEDEDGSGMTLIEHLEELRKRIFKALIAIVVGAVIAFIFRYQIMQFLQYPLPKGADSLTHGQLVTTGLAEGFTVYLMVSVAAGFILALPVILYQTWAFIAPGLYEHEKKYAVPFIFIGIALFAAGISVGYIVLRFPVQWLVAFASDSFTELVTASSYFTFVAFFVLAFGIVFELPLVLTFLAQIGLITSETLTKKRPAAHVGMWVAATFLTPGADIYSPVILGVSMSCLYELTVLFIKFTKK
ncbi:MAG TPA: twin-arginine translocase subunit TatC [Ktedonobacteraceae bacterium]|nr:twin-arginine translocase subunit TatC [Ktedonobacteraceae bacterium]